MMTTDTEKRLAEIRERAEKATKGPWLIKPKLYDDWGWVRSAAGDLVACALAGRYVDDEEKHEHRSAKTDPYQDNMDFIAHSISDIPFLLAEIERLKTNQRPHKGPGAYLDDDLDVKGF